MAQRSIARRDILMAFALVGLTGCSSVGDLLEGSKVDYKSAGKAPTLDVPPDLTQLQRDNRYAIPETNRGTATASGFNLEQGARPVNATAPTVVAANNVQDMRIERAGGQRWLVVRQSPEVLWPQIKDFWQESGFLINVDLPAAGVMETDWAENRAKIPQDFLRKTLGKVLDSLYSTGERDKFRTRLERGPDGTTEIYLSHRGAQEVLTGVQKDGSVWTPRPPDPELEAEFLSKLMARLGADSTRAKTVMTVAADTPDQAKAKITKSASGSSLEIGEGFDRAWRRVGLALDRVGFTVEDRDRVQGVYFVRYVDQNADAKNKTTGGGFLSRLFSNTDDNKNSAQRYRVSVKAAGNVSQIAVQNSDGKPDTSSTADKILGLLGEQLK